MKKILLNIIMCIALVFGNSLFANDNDVVTVTWSIPAIHSLEIDNETIDIGELNYTAGNVNYDDATSSGTYDYLSNNKNGRKITAELMAANVKAGNLYLTLDNPNTGLAAPDVEITNSYGAAVDVVTNIIAVSNENLSIKFDIKNVPVSEDSKPISHNCKLTIVAN